MLLDSFLWSTVGIRRYCPLAVLADDEIDHLIKTVDADGSGEISIEEFETFLHDSPGYREEVSHFRIISVVFDKTNVASAPFFLYFSSGHAMQ